MELFCIALLFFGSNILLSLYFMVKITNKKPTNLHHIYLSCLFLFIVLNVYFLTFFIVNADDLPKVFLFIILFTLVPFAVTYVMNYALFARPLYKYERTLLLLDILKVGLKKGNSPEFTISELAQFRHHGLGGWLNALDRDIRKNGDFMKSISRYKRHLVFPVTDILQAGANYGDLLTAIDSSYETVLANKQSYKSMRRILLYPILPFILILPSVASTTTFILPKFHRIAFELCEDSFSLAWIQGFYSYIPILKTVASLIFIILVFKGWLIRILGLEPVISFLSYYLIPWKRKIVLRNFITLFSAMLHQGLPEEEALFFAAEGTGNKAMTMLAKRATNKLSEGETLPDVLTRAHRR